MQAVPQWITLLIAIGGSQPSGMTLKYMDSADAEQTVTLRVKSDSSKKAATAWIVAMQKVCWQSCICS